MRDPGLLRHESWLKELEYAAVDPHLKGLFGYYALQLGGELNLMAACRMPDQCWVDRDWKQGVDIYADYHALPFLTEQIDLVILPHTLEQTANPHEVLREVTRVLIPEGYVVILGFNPFSFWGIQFNIKRFFRDSALQRLISIWRLREWLNLLGYDIRVLEIYSRPWPLHWTAGWEAGLGELINHMVYNRLGYLVVAQKRVSHPLNIRAKKLKVRPLDNAQWVRPISSNQGLDVLRKRD